jgi:hypothetical protein
MNSRGGKGFLIDLKIVLMGCLILFDVETADELWMRLQ